MSPDDPHAPGSSVSPPPRPPAATKPKRKLAGPLLGGLLGAAIGFFGTRFETELLLPIHGAKWLIVLNAVAIPFVWLGAVGFHEFGHICGGWSSGGRFLLWLVGPLALKRTPAGVRFAWNRSVNVAGGLAVCLPLEPEKITPRGMAMMIAGGPLFSLLLAGAALGAGLWLKAHAGTATSHPLVLMQHATIFTGGISLALFFVTAAPFTAGGFKSDGKRFYELLRGGPRSDQEAALVVLSSASLAGVRPADFDPALVARVLALDDGSLFDLYGRLSIFYYAADRGDWASARSHLDRILAGEAKVAPYVRDTIRCEYAWLLATRDRDAESARAWLAAAGKLEFDRATRLRAEAAVLLAEGNKADAAARAREGLHVLENRSMSPVKSPFAADALSAILQQAES